MQSLIIYGVRNSGWFEKLFGNGFRCYRPYPTVNMIIFNLKDLLQSFK